MSFKINKKLLLQNQLYFIALFYILLTVVPVPALTVNDIQSNGIDVTINCPAGYTEGEYFINNRSGGV